MLMADLRQLPQGFSLLELVIALAIMGVLMALGLPSFNEIIRNSAIRGSAESTLSGFQLAKTEALKRNMTIRLAIVDSLDDTCTLLGAGVTAPGFWIVSRNSAIGGCDAAADPDISISPTSATVFVLIKPPLTATRTIEMTVSANLYCFNSLGMLTDTNCAGATTAGGTIDFTSPEGACRTSLDGDGLACLRVAVSAGGTARMCDPLVTTAGDSRRCP
jgi:type IV fimbrial biogenesis protein FimT